MLNPQLIHKWTETIHVPNINMNSRYGFQWYVGNGNNDRVKYISWIEHYNIYFNYACFILKSKYSFS